MLPLAFALLLSQNIIPTCRCDAAQPETLSRRECSLFQEATKADPQAEVFFLKDINPRKPNRTLAMPRHHAPGRYTLDALSAKERAAVWTAAIRKARELWGDSWAVAYNGDQVRTQCQPHIHIGKLNTAAKLAKFQVVRTPAEIPAPQGKGIWIYADGKRLRVHWGEQITETALVR